MAKYYFVRKITLTLSGERQFHLLSLATGTSFKARLEQELMSNPIFPGMTYRASIVRRGRGLIITSFDSAFGVGFDECKALAGFVSAQKALPQYAPPSGLANLLVEAGLVEKRSVRQLLHHESQFILGKYLGDAQTAQLQFAWEDYMAFQMSVLGFMRQGFDQATAERMVTCLSVGAGYLQAYPPTALPFLEPDSTSVVHSGFELNSGLRHAWGLLRYLEAQSLAGNTVVEVNDLIVRLCSAGGSSAVDGQGAVEGGGAVEGSFSGGSDDVIEAIRQCEHRGWIVATDRKSVV